MGLIGAHYQANVMKTFEANNSKIVQNHTAILSRQQVVQQGRLADTTAVTA